MKTVRFSKLVEAAGKPEPYLVLRKPEEDRTLQAAIRANRVATVHQQSAGTKTDHGAVGFDPGPSRQYLIFPRGVGRFKARRIVGINYDLLAGDPRPARAQKNPKPRLTSDTKKKPPEHSASPRQPSRKTLRVTKPPTPKKPRPAKPKPSAAEKRKRERDKALAGLTQRVRKALQYLEAGKRTPALNILKRTLQIEESS
jgi:hypothetical protein